MAQPPARANEPPAKPAQVTPGGSTQVRPAPGADRARRIDPSKIKSADDLLTALETADAGLRTFSADIKFVRTFGELEGNATHDRRGSIVYVTEPTRKFRVDFTQAYIDGVKRDEVETYIFDGRRLIERHPEQKQQIERILAGIGEQADPLAIGNGPFPVPIGQKKAEMLRRFTAELLAPEAGWTGKFPPSLADTFQLRLVPRPGTDEAKQFKDIRLWYVRETLLPRLARTTEPEGAGVEVLLINQRENAPVEDAAFNAALPAGWPPPQVIELRRETDEGSNGTR